MVKIAIEIISLLLFLAFFAWIMYIIIRGIWSSFDNKEDKKYEKLIGENNSLKIENNDLKTENQNLLNRIEYLENNYKKEKTTKKSKNLKKHE